MLERLATFEIVLKSRVRKSGDYSEETHCLVKYVDYGSLQIVPLSSLRHVDSDMTLVLQTPFLAVRYRKKAKIQVSRLKKAYRLSRLSCFSIKTFLKEWLI